VWLGLLRLGYDDHATELVRRISGPVATHHLREYYEPYTGEGMGTTDFAWSALLVDMLERDPRAAASYL
jgi:hypothetical protein